MIRRLGKVLGLVLLAAVCVAATDAGRKPEHGMPFKVYADGGAKENHFIPSGFTGDFGAIQMLDKCKDRPQAGNSCIRFTYTGEAPQKANWAGVFFQSPANNWGTSDGGFDLTGATKLKFYARGDKGGEVVEFKVGGVNGAYSDSDTASTGPIQLTSDWKLYEIPLTGLDLSYIFSGFAWIATSERNPEGFVIYLDEVEYVSE